MTRVFHAAVFGLFSSFGGLGDVFAEQHYPGMPPADHCPVSRKRPVARHWERDGPPVWSLAQASIPVQPPEDPIIQYFSSVLRFGPTQPPPPLFASEVVDSDTLIHIPPDVPGFLRDQGIETSAFVPRSVRREPSIAEGVPRDSAITRRKFSREEDDLLRQLVGRYGLNDWAAIAQQMPNRDPRQCRCRWKHYLSGGPATRPWTPEEDYLLISKMREWGPRWVKLAQFFPDRTDLQLKNRWLSTLAPRIGGRISPRLH
ncbi:MAG: hypothetical protein LBF66_00470 [Holosporales bacterium]|jgi:hypothetical protein|nr:hypothetical protein [Holosporales bacterium]